MKKIKLFLAAIAAMVGVSGYAQTDEQYDAALGAITDGNYGIVAVYQDKMYAVDASGYLTDDAYNVGTFEISQKTDGEIKSTGFRMNNANGRFTNGGDGNNVVTSTTHLALNAKQDRSDFECQVLYLNDEGYYAVRTTNSTSTSWGASAYWTVADDITGDYMPEATYTFGDVPYVWQFIPEADFEDVKFAISNSRKTRILAQLNSYKNDAAYTNDKTNLLNLISTIEAASTMEEIHNATAAADIATVIDEFKYANTTYPYSMTSVITNPGFETEGGAGWTMEAGNKNLHGGKSNFCAESWRSAFTLSQTVSIPNGYYKLRAQAALTEYDVTGENFPVVYATAGSTVMSQFKTMQHGEASMDVMSQRFSGGEYYTDWTDAVKVTGKSITIGVKGTRTNTWCIWDNFQLMYLGPIDLSEFVQGLADAVDAAEAYKNQLPDAVYANIASVIAEYNKAYDDSEGYSSAIIAINNAVSTYATAAIIADYARYQSIKTQALAIASTTSTTASDEAVEAATTTETIDTAIATLRAAFRTALSNVAIPEDPGYIDVTAVMVNNASVSQNVDGWTVENVVRPVSWGTGPTTNFGETEFYQSTFDFNQSVTLPAGTWEFGVTGFHRAGTYQTYFYAGDDRILLPGESSDVVNSMADAKTYFDNGNGKVALKFGLEDESNTIKIGIINEDTETDRWTIFRDFTLKYYGSKVDYSVYTARWVEALNAANDAKANETNINVTGSELTALNNAIADAPTEESKKADYNNKINTLVEATAAFNAAAPSYDAYVAYKAETVKLWGSDLGVAAPTTAAAAAAAIQNLNIAQYNKVASDYTFSATGLIGDFGSWTGTATYGTDKTASTPNYLDYEHWSGKTHAYYEQCKEGWGNAGGWTIKYEKKCTLPAGDYVIKVAGRSSGGTTSLVSCTATDKTVTLPNIGASTRGINTSGVASWSDDDTFAIGDTKSEVGGSGKGWEWRFLPFSLKDQTEVTMTFYAEASTQYQWMSIADGELLSKTNIATAVAYDEAATNTIEDVDVANVTMTRTIKEGFNTVVVPFTLTANQVTAAFGTGTEVYAFSEDSNNANDVTINFSKGDGSITANVPVLVKATAESKEQVFEGVQIVAPTADVKVEGKYTNFIGVYTPGAVIAGDYFVGRNTSGEAYLYKSEGDTKINAFRAYIDAQESGSDVKLFIDGVATSINAINGVEAENGAIFNLAGQRVNKAQKGIYIVNGKKVLVK